ncbi:molybdenum cofactor biosynthesis protein B [Rouxiella badensis]|jgi:molybdenum cofactor biosynthesis protein B|uniref:Molybdenum cofactor biosynthesis protein B n=1 Tax=Rouxiella badensis TaxID=1646377 RepID=A0A1X0WL01_9GAMM|nr:molybdenum cofactor biosynthesis protein B [Rouxiella badensis]MCC3700973.1 molybdenum cofactor biosynthesis protein B [Rouxiella badensis]ORJ27458.1 molybdenum cofactor biosynthesis protein B [Rouxiella badensis]WAT04788.1 molybdenum cofactor biosynthesis protein B [Rouxiella badensis]
MSKASSEFQALSIAILTVSDKRTETDDTSGDYLREAVEECGHHVVARQISKDNLYQIRAVVSQWIADEKIGAVIINGGTGFTTGDNTPEALKPLFDREIEGFGELFRMVSFEDIGTATIQSRALAGMANQTVIFAVPGSTNACKLAWEHIISSQLDARNRPCNFIPHVRK